MATVSKWTPFGVALDITATGGTVTRTSATQFTVKINVSWETYYSGAQTNYGMSAHSGGASVTINKFGTKASSGSGTLTGTYTISGNGSATKTISVQFKNFNNDNGDAAYKNVTFNVTVPAWTSYKITYNANGGTGAPSAQTKWKDQTLKLSSTKPTRTGHAFKGWSTSSTATSATYQPGANYTGNSNVTLYAVWEADTYLVHFNANGGTGAPATQTKTYGKNLTLSSTKPTRQNYTFMGWGLTSSISVISYQPGSVYTNNAAITLHAVWKLSYVPPRISSIGVHRCDVNGLSNDNGDHAIIAFDWQTDYSPHLIRIDYKKSEDSTWVTAITSNPSEYDDTITEATFMNDDPIFVDPEYTYIFRVTITDKYGTSAKNVTLPGSNFVIDLLVGGTGISFGKIAELENVADFAYTIRTLGGLLHPELEPETDLNELLTPNTYVGDNVSNYNYVNCPITAGTFTLEVTGAGFNGQIRQRLQVCDKVGTMTYERYYYQGSFGPWYETGSTMSCISVNLSTNATLGVLNTYTAIPFNATKTKRGKGLNLSDNGVRIGVGVRYARISAFIKIGTGSVAGNRHLRLCQMKSDGSINYLTWITVELDASTQTAVSFTPIITNVEEGDLIYAVFYTPDVTDVIGAGNSTNGLSTYLTVESI